MLAEAMHLGEELGNTEIRVEAMAWRVPSFVAVGDTASARRELPALRQTAEATAQPLFMHMAEQFGSAIALADGRLAEADAMAWRSYEAGQLLTGRDASGTYGIQMFGLRREQGRLAELAPVMRIITRVRPRARAMAPGARVAARRARNGGRGGPGARADHGEGLDPFRESLWLALAHLHHRCVRGLWATDGRGGTGVSRARTARGNTNVMIGQLVACYGSVDRYLGMLATTLGEWQRAEQHFEHALAQNRQMGPSTWLAHTAVRVRATAAGPRRQRPAASGCAAERGGTARPADRPARRCRAGSRPWERRIAAASLPDELSGREAQILRLVAAGSPIARSGRASPSASTPRQATSAAS